MPAPDPTSKHLTIRFKNAKTTLLLHILPTQSLSSVRAEVLSAVKQTNPSGVFNGKPIPSDASEVILAQPADVNDLSRGWERVNTNPDADDDVSGKGKGRATTIGRARPSQDTIQALGLRDGGVLAFRFKSEDDADSENKRKHTDEGVSVEELEGEILVGEPEKWNVVMPTLDEMYGENAAPEAGTKPEALLGKAG